MWQYWEVGSLRGAWVLEGRALMSGISDPVRRDKRTCLLSSQLLKTQQKVRSLPAGRTFSSECGHAGTLISDLQPPELREITVWFFISCTVMVLCYKGLNYCSQSQSHTSLQKRLGDVGHLGAQTENRKQIGEHIVFLSVLNIYFDFLPTQEHIPFPRETTQSCILTPSSPSQDHRWWQRPLHPELKTYHSPMT